MRAIVLLCAAALASLAWAGLDIPMIGPGQAPPPQHMEACPLPPQRPPQSRASADLLYAGLLLIPFDKPLARNVASVRRGERASDLTEACNALGDPRLLLASAAAIRFAGKAADEDTAGAVASAVLRSQLCATTAKIAIGRARPDRNDAGRFDGPTLANGHGSFPSGHAAAAFAVATVLAKKQPKQKILYYGLAALASLARVRKGAHYVSDICVGAWIGIQSGRAATSGICGTR
jgi:undecaprenyl-diphosphatase